MAKTTPQPKSNDDDFVVKPWELLASEMALNDKWMPIRRDTVKLPSGKILDDFLLWESPDVSVAIPITEDGKFVVCQQYRHATQTIFYQFPSGGIDGGETPEEAAMREMEEESGYTGGKMNYFGKCTPFGPKMTGWHHIFLFQGAKPGGKKEDNPNEESKVYLKTPAELEQMIKDGVFLAADSLVGAFWAFRLLGL